MSEVEALLVEVLACRRLIEFTALTRKASNRLAPSQLGQFYRAVDLPAFARQRKAFKETAPYWSYFRPPVPFLRKELRNFRNTQISDDVRFFEDTDFAVGEKSLLIMVSGYSGRVMVPLALLLDCLPKRPTDVLFLQSAGRDQYRLGAKGLGANLLQVAITIKERFQSDRYKRVDVLGSSAGGFPALQLANFIGADNGVSLSGAYPYDILRLGKLARQRIAGFHSLCACAEQRAERLVCAYAVGADEDADQAILAAKSLPRIILYPVAGPKQHGFLQALFRHRQLEKFMRLMLSDLPRPPKLSRLGFYLKGALFRR